MAEMTLSWKETVDNPVDSDIKENKITFRYAHNGSTYFLDSASVDVYLDKENFSNAQRTLDNNSTVKVNRNIISRDKILYYFIIIFILFDYKSRLFWE